MPAAPELRDQLRSLSIPREQRPGNRAGGGRALTVAVLALVIFALAGFIVWERLGPQLAARGGTAPTTQPLRLFKVAVQNGSGDATPILTATGKIVSDHRVEVATKVSGQVVALYFEQGDSVERGQILAALDDEAPRARRDEAAARLTQARATLEFQKVNCARITSLHAENQASDIEYADARRALEDAGAAVRALEATLAYHEKVVRDCQVQAPIAGVILERNVEVGDFVAAEGGRGAMANAQVAAIADMGKLRVEVDISELDIARVRTDMACTVVPDAYKDRHYRGRVLWIDPGANYSKATIQVKVRIEAPDTFLRVEGAAQVQFFRAAPEAAATSPTVATLWIPVAACRWDGKSSTGQVFVASDGRLKATPVTLGRREGERVEVLAGLHEGQEIVAEGVDRLRDGQAAR
jgi:RND family efflux transporter MFP subunit